MGYKNRVDAETEACLNEALLFATMCIIGLPVDVHIKDGSVYSGTFHTASFDKKNGIVLKEAKLTKKGKCDANVANGSVIETLVILSGDIVQVVAKGVLFPADGVTGHISGDNMEAAVTRAQSSEVVSEAKKSNKFVTDRKKSFNQNRSLTQNKISSAHGLMSSIAGNDQEGTKMPLNHIDNAMEVEHGKRDGIYISKKEGSSGDSNDGRRQTADNQPQGEQDHDRQKFEFQREKSADESHSSDAIKCNHTEARPIAEEQAIGKSIPNGLSSDSAAELSKQNNQYRGNASPNTVCAGVSTASNPVIDVPSESHHSTLAYSTDVISPQVPESNRSSKAFKLNPAAKIFSPSLSNPTSATASAVPTVPSLAYIPSNSHMVPVSPVQSETGIPFAPRSSIPAKLPHYSNLTAANGGTGSQFSQPVAGNIGSRAQPLRYSGQYHAVQAASAYLPPNSQAVIVGRLGQLVYVQPVSHDLVPNTAAISPISARPLLTPQPVQYPKHQGSAAGQTLQICVAPPFIAGWQQPYIVPSHVPFLQPPIPAIRPISVPGSYSLYSTKFP